MNDREIWNYLQRRTNNAFGTAAIMGNLMAESSLNSKAVAGIQDPDYVSKSDDGLIDFVHDGHAFGLAQWAFFTRKEALLNFAKLCSVSVGDPVMQLDFLIEEMSNSYKMVWNEVIHATNIREASDIVMLRYEKPANTSEKARQRRASLGQQFYNRYAHEESFEEPVDPTDVFRLHIKHKEIEPLEVVVKEDRLNVRLRNEPDFITIFLENS